MSLQAYDGQSSGVDDVMRDAVQEIDLQLLNTTNIRKHYAIKSGQLMSRRCRHDYAYYNKLRVRPIDAVYVPFSRESSGNHQCQSDKLAMELLELNEVDKTLESEMAAIQRVNNMLQKMKNTKIDQLLFGAI